MISETIAHYRILEKLGAGGMGEVYRARDTKLDRIVALKILPQAMASDKEYMRRFIQEAKATSGLSHPNLAHIYEIGQSEGVSFIAMEFIEGETLRARMKVRYEDDAESPNTETLRARIKAPVTLDQGLEIATQVATGLAVAHRHGIIHRDLKPENIMLRVDGYVKLVDFGLAKVMPWSQGTSTEPTASSPPTQTGQLIGTFNYMSPEQARGLALTPASDVFSFGIVFYEVLTGEHPFRSETVMDTLNAILTKEPPLVSERCPLIQQEISEIVVRSLRKEPGSRYPSAVELLDSLQQAGKLSSVAASEQRPVVRSKPVWVKGVGVALIAALLAITAWIILSPAKRVASPPIQSVAVMTLRTSADDARASALVEQLSEDLSGALAKTGLQVASRSSVLGLAGTGDPRIVGSQLGVDAVLEGSVRNSGSQLRVHVELVSSRTGFQVWSETFTAEPDELLGGQSTTAAEIAKRLRSAIAAPQ